MLTRFTFVRASPRVDGGLPMAWYRRVLVLYCNERIRGRLQSGCTANNLLHFRIPLRLGVLFLFDYLLHFDACLGRHVHRKAEDR